MMRRMLVLTMMCVLLIGACGDDGGDAEAEADTPAVDDGSSEGDAEGDGDGDGEGGTDAEEEAAGGSDSGATGSAMGTATIDGTVYEFPDVRDCGLGGDGFPNDRDFVGYSADGEVVMTVGYFEDESLAGLNSISVEIDDPHALYSSQYAPEGEFMIEVRPDGADGSTTVGAVGIEVESGDRDATWSFSC